MSAKDTPRAATILLDSKFQNSCYGSGITLFLAIMVIGSIPGARQNVGQFASGLILHSTAYAILGALIFLGSRGSASRRALCTVITIAVTPRLSLRAPTRNPWILGQVLDDNRVGPIT